MKAVIVEAPKKVSVREVPDPVMDDYDVICSLEAAGICSGTDNNIVNGDPYHKVSFPAILGHESIGRVIKQGKKVKHFDIGDLITRVYNKLPENSGYSILYGGFAEFGIATDWLSMKEDGLPISEWSKYTVNRVLPDTFNPIESVMIITWRETLSFLTRMEIGVGSNILILGTGGNALSFVEHARNAGHKTVIVGSTKRKEIFEKVGAQTVFSYKDDNIVEKIKEASLGHFDVIIDVIGDKEYMGNFLSLLKQGGKVGVYGLNKYDDYGVTDGEVKGGVMYFDGEIYSEGSAHDSVIKSIEKGDLNAWHYLSKDHIYPLAKIKEALLASAERKVIKSVISFV